MVKQQMESMAGHGHASISALLNVSGVATILGVSAKTVTNSRTPREKCPCNALTEQVESGEERR
jgi:hypothetical protein